MWHFQRCAPRWERYPLSRPRPTVAGMPPSRAPNRAVNASNVGLGRDTAQPDDEMIDVAVSAMRAAMGTVPIEPAAADVGQAATEQGDQQGG